MPSPIGMFSKSSRVIVTELFLLRHATAPALCNYQDARDSKLLKRGDEMLLDALVTMVEQGFSKYDAKSRDIAAQLQWLGL